MPHRKDSLRIGITGVPGVGKSTFIERLGLQLIEQGHRLAILAVDPSSASTGGSILGDKTRMEQLSLSEQAFIRPSPTGNTLGGVARRTREAILLCEAAGYDLIFVETVGVGQSETKVALMTDFFMLLMLAGAGDELQGIKRGIMEMADLMVINKADRVPAQELRLAMGEYKRALHLFPPKVNEWVPEVLSASAEDGRGVSEVWAMIDKFARQQKLKGYFAENRQQQALRWFEDAIGEMMTEAFHQSDRHKQSFEKKRLAVQQGQLEPGLAAQQLIDEIWN